MKRISLILITIISILALSSCSKSKGNIESTEFLDFDTVELKEYKNEVAFNAFLPSFESKVEDSFSILEDDFIITEDRHTFEFSKKKNSDEYETYEEVQYTMDGMYDSDNKILERRNKSSKSNLFKEIEYNNVINEAYYQNIEKDDKYYEIDLLDNSYQERLDNISATINYLYNTIFNAKYDFKQYNYDFNNFVTNYDYVKYYQDDNIYTVIYDNQDSTYFHKKDSYQIEFNTNSVILDINLYMQMKEYDRGETYKLHAEIRNEDVKISSSLPSVNKTVELKIIDNMKEDYLEQMGYEIDIKSEDILGNVNGYTIYFMKTNLTSMYLYRVDGSYFGCGSSFVLYAYKNGEFLEVFDLYDEYEKLQMTDFIKIAERYYLQNVSLDGSLDEWYFGMGNTMFYDHLAFNAWT